MDLSTASYIFTVGIIIWLIGVLSLWQVFVKAEYEGWKSLIPVYNSYILTKIAGQPLWVFICLFVPVVNVVSIALISLGVAKAFGRGFGMAVVLILFSYFGYMYLGWGQAKYVGAPAESN